MNAFDPRYPPVTNSLNRLRLESALMPTTLRGTSGYELVSTLALSNLIAEHASSIAPDEQMAWFYQQIEVSATWAVEIAETIGTRLGGLLLALLRNDEQTHRANPDKDAAYWAYWAGVRMVYLGGGLVMGKMGHIVAARAQAVLRTHSSDPNCRVIQSANPLVLPLLGAARTITARTTALVLDFGGTYIKRATAHYDESGLTRLQIHQSLPSSFPPNTEDAQLLFERMTDIIVQSYDDADTVDIPISIAAYVDAHGQPLFTQGGIYMHLARLTPDVPAALSQSASERLRKTVQVRLLHDGTAAALYYAPQKQAAVIMTGTALGSGYPVDRPNLPLCPVSTGFAVNKI